MPLIKPLVRRHLALATALAAVAAGAAAAAAVPPATVWVSPISGVNDTWAADVAPDGSIYSLMSGDASWVPAMTFGTGGGAITITPGGNGSMALAKQNADGSWAWVWGSATSPRAWDMAAMPDGGAAVAGWRPNAGFGGAVGGNTVPAQGSFVAKFSPTSAISWFAEARPITYGGSDNVNLNGVAPVPGGGGSSVVAGYYNAGMTVNLLPAVSPITLSGLGRSGSTAFLAGLNASGSWTWTLKSDAGDSGGNGVKALPDGSAIMGGFLAGSAQFGSTALTGTGAFFAKGSAAGWQWAAQVVYSGESYIRATSKNFALGPDGSVYFTDSFTGTATFGTGPGAISLTSSGDRDVFVAKLNPNGTWAWATKAGGAGQERAYSVSVPPGVCTPVVTGLYANAAQFGSLNLSSGNAREDFLAMIGTDGTWRSAYDVAQAASLWNQGPVVALADGSLFLQGSMVSPTTFGTLPVSGGNQYSGKMLQAPCGAPQNVTATAGDGQATVSWDAVPGGSVTRYTVTASPDGKTCTATAPATSCVIEGLTNGTTYTFKVVAVNAAGSGPESAEAKITPAANAQAAAEENPKITIPAAVVVKGATLTSTVKPSVAGTVRVTATLAGRTACTVTKKATKAGRMKITCTLNARTRAIIKGKAVTLKVTARLTDAAGKTATASRNVKVARYVVRTSVTG